MQNTSFASFVMDLLPHKKNKSYISRNCSFFSSTLCSWLMRFLLNTVFGNGPKKFVFIRHRKHSYFKLELKIGAYCWLVPSNKNWSVIFFKLQKMWNKVADGKGCEYLEMTYKNGERHIVRCSYIDIQHPFVNKIGSNKICQKSSIISSRAPIGTKK